MMFQWDDVDTSPDLGGQNVLKTFKWLFDIEGGRHEQLESTGRRQAGAFGACAPPPQKSKNVKKKKVPHLKIQALEIQ